MLFWSVAVPSLTHWLMLLFFLLLRVLRQLLILFQCPRAGLSTAGAEDAAQETLLRRTLVRGML